MKQRERLLGLRVNGNVRIGFAPQSFTSYAGLELFSRHLRHLRFNELLRGVFARHGFASDHGLNSLVRLMLTLLLVGAVASDTWPSSAMILSCAVRLSCGAFRASAP